MTTTTPEPEAIAELEYFGEGAASIDGGPEGEYQSISSWNLAPAGTYGIG